MSLSNADKVEDSGTESILIKKLGTKLLAVVFRKTDNMIFIITAYMTSRIDKYLK